jgi:hypothetical protein
MAREKREERERYGIDPWTYYDRSQEYFGPEYEGRYDPRRDRFVRSPEWEEGQYPEDAPHKTYFRSTFQTNPFGREEQAGPSPATVREGPYAGIGPKGYKRSDQSIYEEVCELLTEHPMIDASDIEVRVRDGIVMLLGTTKIRRTKRLAEDIAANVPGVRDVQNQIRIESVRWSDEVSQA